MKSIVSVTAAGTVAAGTVVLTVSGSAHAQAQAPAAFKPAYNVAFYKQHVNYKPPVPATPPGPARYTVRNGDTLTGIAARECHDQADWTGLDAANKHVIGADYNLIFAGQHLILDCRTADIQVYDPPPPPRPVYDPAPVQVDANVNVSPADYSGFQACVVARESGGNSQVMNASGHYGLYQFDLGTWESGGGSPADFGHASVAEQNQVFQAVYAARGASPWAPYDGC